MPTLATPKKFFDAIRPELFHGSMTEDQVKGCETIIGVWPAKTDSRWVADGLATGWWETDFTMSPVPEIGRGHGRKYGLPAGPYGEIYYGRGLVQLTWEFNYKMVAQKIPGCDVYRRPDRALDPEIAAEIMTRGMTEGWFTGRKLEDYFPLADPECANWTGARRIINGNDHAADIAHAAVHFWKALGAGGYTP